MRINKTIGKRGSINIPYELRLEMGLRYNDVVSFEKHDSNSIIIRRVKICDECRHSVTKTVDKPTDETTLLDFIDGLSAEEQRAAFVHLTMKWTDLQGGDKRV